jgi:hypothetical protein
MNSDQSKAVAQDLVNYAISGAQTMYAAQKKAVQNNVLPFNEHQLAYIPVGISQAGMWNIIDYQGYAEDGRFELPDDELAEVARMIKVVPG